MDKKSYIAIDLKSFYASVECVERGLDPLNTNLVVADNSRTEKTICLAVSPSLKELGISGRARLFEVIQKINEHNNIRKRLINNKPFDKKSYYKDELNKNPYAEIDYITAVPRMSFYVDYSTKIYNIYLKYVSEKDIHIYSIDEVFIDATSYLATYNITAYELAERIISDVLNQTGITATVGIGTNMYLCKIAMDIMAKKMKPNKNGARIAELDEISYRINLWEHTPLTDFWRIGRGYAKRLEQIGLYTMGDIARCSVGKSNEYYNEDLLYKVFGVNAELLIDHAWGWEPCNISDVKAYKPQNSSLSSGQVLHTPYDFEHARLILREMIDFLVLDLVDKGLVCNNITLNIGYDIDNLKNIDYKGDIVTDIYGRKMPKPAHGTVNIGKYTSSTKYITMAAINLFDKIVDDSFLIRRINIAVGNVKYENCIVNDSKYEQLDLFTDYNAVELIENKEKEFLIKEKNIQKAILKIKKKYGKNAVLKGMNYCEGATGKDRNEQIGGHKA